MVLAPAAAAAATLLAIALLCAGGYLTAVALLGAERCRRDPLALAIAALVGATAQGLLIALVLGMSGTLRFLLALSIQALLVGLLLRARRRRATPEAPEGGAGPSPVRVLGQRTADRLREHPLLALLALHALGSEALRGLLRPPLSWDSLMYHLLLTATWLQDHALSVVYGAYPTNYYGYAPANGSLWLWWWMAPSHSELYVNCAFLPHWLLLGLATGGVARELGARRSWPLAAYLVLLCPTVVRFAATEYVDILLGAMLVAATFFGLVWLRGGREAGEASAEAAKAAASGETTKTVAPGEAARVAAPGEMARGAGPGRDGEARPGRDGEARPGRDGEARPGVAGAGAPRLADALYAGMAAGIAAGSKLIGPPFAVVLAAGLLLAVRGSWGARLRQAFVAALVAGLLGGYFYLRNMAEGAGPLAMACVPASGGSGEHRFFPNPLSALGTLGPLVARGTLVDTFLGTSIPASIELGIGPQGILLLPALLLPLLVPARLRRPAFVVWMQIVAQLAFWFAVPQATGGLVFANVRYLIAAIGLAFAGLLAACEQRGIWERSERAVVGLAAALLVQDLLMLHAEMPREVRLAMAAADLAAALVLFSPALRERLRRLAGAGAGAAERRARGRRAVAAGLALGVVLLAGAPWLASFRAADRTRALATEYTAHDTKAHIFARAWGWLERHGGDGTVAVAINPGNYFVYPAMGMGLDRRAVYVNVNRQDRRRAIDYPGCGPRIDGDPAAWVENLDKLGVRWLHLGRFEGLSFPGEARWAQARPDRFTLRYADPLNLIYELSPPPRKTSSGTSPPEAGSAPALLARNGGGSAMARAAIHRRFRRSRPPAGS